LPADFPGTLNKAWHAAQDVWRRFAPNAKHKIATKARTYIQAQEPQLVIDAIKRCGCRGNPNPAMTDYSLIRRSCTSKKARPVIVNISNAADWLVSLLPCEGEG
jgi:hypothetical protein